MALKLLYCRKVPSQCFAIANSPIKSLFPLNKWKGLIVNEGRCLSSYEEKNQMGTVYYGTLTPQIRAVKLFSLLTSFTGLALQPYLYKSVVALDSIPLTVTVCTFVGFFTLVTPFLLHFITKKYVTSLVYDPQSGNYKANTLGFFNLKKEIVFKPEDVKVPDVLGMFTSFYAKNQPLFVDPKLFEDPKHYGKIMGYDKPLDLKLYRTSFNEKEK